MLRAIRITALALFLPALALAQTGQLNGTISGADGPLEGVTIVINEVGMAEITDSKGAYRLTGVPPGAYTITFSLADNLATAAGVVVESGKTTTLDQNLAWEVNFAETITVYSASRRRERIVEAPAAVTVVSEDEIEREASHGQLPKLLEATPGAEITQSGLYDFNLNTRGFNSSLNRRVPSLIDGRDPSVPFLGAQDWSALAGISDLASAELVRGPSSALYGTNAFNGILNLTTKQPRYSRGGTLRLTGGELSTARADVRFAYEIGSDLFVKAMGSYSQSDDYYVSRNLATEYSSFCGTGQTSGCLRREAAPVATTEDELLIANLRFDKYMGSGDVLTFEVGTSTIEGPVLQTGIGRVQVLESDRPWARFNYNSQHFNLLSYYNTRDAPKQLALASGGNLILDSTIWATELQGNAPFAGGKGQVVGGLSYRDEEIETGGTLTAAPVGGEREAAFAQIDYAFSNRFKVVAAARWDDSSLHDSKVSPKLALVFSPSANQTIRATYNEAFQSPNYSEFFLAAPGAAPVNLAGAAALFGFPQLVQPLTLLGFAPMPILARGNENLQVEEISTWEIGYSGILGGKVFLTADYYNSELENFVTDLLPGVNPTYTPYVIPIPLPPASQAGILGFLQVALGGNFAGLTNLPDGSPAVVVSYANAGSADSEGVDLGLTWYVDDKWNLSLAYSWFDFEITSQQLGDVLLPNAPETQYSVGLNYVADRFDFGVNARFVDDFGWAAGVFQGPIPSYEVVNLNANFAITESIGIGVNVSNVFDDEHYEAFGGDLLTRRALGTVKFSW